MAACVFVIMCAYYMLKTAREGLILSGGMLGLRGDELKIYASGAMALLLVGVVPAYGRLASRVGRMRLIATSYSIVIACLVAFYALAMAGAPIALPYFVWLGIVNVFLVAQFWSFANDIYTEEQGKRLFGGIAVGGALGAIVGPRIAGIATTFQLLLLAGVLLAGALALFFIVDARKSGRSVKRDEPITGAGGFALVLRDKYLLAIAAMVLVANLVNTIGEFLLASSVADHAAQVATTTAGRREVITAFYGEFFAWVNLASFVLQTVFVSRAIKKFGVRANLFILPVIALGTYGAIAAIGGFALIRSMKIAENSADYSIQNTVRQTLFLPTSRAVKYKAKAAIDTFFMRFGDTLSAIVVLVGVHQLHLAPAQLAVVNVVLVVVWLALALAIARRHRALEAA
jgi:AAA family ATP:ADP antiporter